MEWRNRIVDTGTRPAYDFLANPHNWRIHPKAQREALKGVLGDVGWVVGVLVNRRTGHLIDGHARVEEALKLGDETPIPYTEVDLSEEEEALILASFDPISAMAAADKSQLEGLLAEVKTDSAAIQEMLSNLGAQNALMEPPDFKEYDETTADDVEMTTCPKCGHTYPK